MLSTGRIEDLTSEIYWAWDLLNSFEDLDTDKIAQFETPDQLNGTLGDLDMAIRALQNAREITLELLGRED